MKAIDMVRHLKRRRYTLAEVLAVDLDDAKATLRAHRVAHGFADRDAPLLTPPSGNVKLAKGAGTWGLTLAPADSSGRWNVCPWSTRGCRTGCVITTAGKGALPSVQRARNWKTDALGDSTLAFLRVLVHELDKLPAGALVRLNTGADIPWEDIAPWLFDRYSHLRFYDYTKGWKRTDLPDNYRLTYSASERTTVAQVRERAAVAPVAVVVNITRGHPLPVGITDGDADDNRFDDTAGVIGLRAKGAAIKNGERFVFDAEAVA